MSNFSIAQTISDIIENNGLSQQMFAKSINVNQSQVSDWIAGKCKPGFDSLRDICINYNISGDDLLGVNKTDDKELDTKYKIGNRRYTGSKLKLKTWIRDLIAENCPGCDSFCDIFAGTGVVTDAMLDMYSHFILNDFLYSNEVIYKAFYKNQNFSLNRLRIYKDKYQSLDYESLDDNYVSLNFGGKYFEYNDAKAIGYIRQDIEDQRKNLNDREYSIIIASLLYSLDKCANTVGHYEAYFKNKTLSSSFTFNLIKPYDTAGMGKKIDIYREDSNLLAPFVKADIVYIDPPYSSRQYSRFYHVLETITKWDFPQLSGTAMKPPVENMSTYCSNSALASFTDLIQKLKCKYIVVSYNNTYNSKSDSSQNKMELEDIEAVLSSKGKTTIHAMPFKAFNAGKTDMEGHKEYIFITEVNQIDKT